MAPVSARATNPITPSRAVAVLVVLTAINFLNYLDRYVLASVLESVRLEFGLTDGSAGFLGLMFIIVYTVVSPFTGWLGDRSTRKYLVAGGVILWSAATVGCGYARTYEGLLFMRALVGIGEAGYATVAPSMIADLYGPQKRGRMLAYFYLAIPVGSALGYVLGGAIAGHWDALVSPEFVDAIGLGRGGDPGWRLAFVFAGAPGLVFGAAAMFLREPTRGASDSAGEAAEAGLDSPIAVIKRLFATPAWRSTTGGMVLMTFSLGGIAFWAPAFLQRAHGMSEASAGMVFGGIAVVAGLLATLTGGYLGDRAFAQSQGGYLRVSGWGMLIGVPAVFLMAGLDWRVGMLAAAFVGEFFLFLNTGPLNAALVGCVPNNLRASSIAINVLFIHAFGDAISPYLMGALSDLAGPSLAGTWFGDTAEAAGLRLAVGLAALPMIGSGLWLLHGARRIDTNPDGLTARD